MNKNLLSIIVKVSVISGVFALSCFEGELNTFDLSHNNWLVCHIKNDRSITSGNSCLEISFNQNNSGKIIVNQKVKDSFGWKFISKNVIRIDSVELINNGEYAISKIHSDFDRFTLTCSTCMLHDEMILSKKK